jgi:hypothetical protein
LNCTRVTLHMGFWDVVPIQQAMPLWTFAVGLGVGASGMYLFIEQNRPMRQAEAPSAPTSHASPTDAASVVRYDAALKFGVPTTDHIRCACILMA